MIGSVFKILGSALSLWEIKEKRKYIDRYMKLKKEWYEEYNSPQRDDAVLDNIEFDLQLLVDAISSQIEASDPKNS